MSKYLSKRQYIESNKDMAALLNQYWEIKPKKRYIAARALIGPVIVDIVVSLFYHWSCMAVIQKLITMLISEALLDPRTNQHQCLLQAMVIFILVLCVKRKEKKNISMKPILGTYPFNTLVTSSMRIDNLLDQPECRPNTVNCVVPPQFNSKYKIYLDSQSWSDSLLLESNSNLDSIYSGTPI